MRRIYLKASFTDKAQAREARNMVDSLPGLEADLSGNTVIVLGRGDDQDFLRVTRILREHDGEISVS